MKTFILVSLMAAGVFRIASGDEKDVAIETVNKKFAELLYFSKSIEGIINTEKSKTDPEFEKKTKEEIQNNANNVLKELDEATVANARTAIAKGKPLTAIDCLGKEFHEGKYLIEDTKKNYLNAAKEVVKNKGEILQFALFEVNLIQTASTELKNQILQKINGTSTGFGPLVDDAEKKSASAKKQLLDLGERAPKPALTTEYIKLRQQALEKYKQIKESVIKKLQKCVA